jgi:hypothetical protein
VVLYHTVFVRVIYDFLVYFRWYFTMLSLSGLFSVTFSVVFAYVADITTNEDRGQAYGLVSV